MTVKPKYNESQVLGAIMDYLWASRIFAFRINNTPIYNPREGRFRSKGKYELYGVADILGVYKGRMLAIEVKRPGGKPSDYQTIFLNKVNQSGGIAFIATSVDEVITKLKTYGNASQTSEHTTPIRHDQEIGRGTTVGQDLQ